MVDFCYFNVLQRYESFRANYLLFHQNICVDTTVYLHTATNKAASFLF